MNIKIINIFLLFFIICPHFVNANVIEVSVEAEGTGTSYNNAINSALTNAVSKVTGMQIENASSVVSNSIKKTSNLDLSLSSKSLVTNNTTATKTVGHINSYEVLNKRITSNKNHHVKVMASIYKYEPSMTSSRKRLAFLPTIYKEEFTNFFGDIHSSEIASMFNSNLEQLIVQARKFSVLSRQELEQIGSELSLMSSNMTPTKEKAKIGQIVGADLLLMTEVVFAEVTQHKKLSQITGQVSSLINGAITINVKVIDTVTSEIKYSSIHTQEVISEITREELLNRVAKKTANELVHRIYPIRIINVKGNNVTLNFGGDKSNIGQLYEVFETGEKLIDPYTGESLGTVERNIGRLQISKITGKVSYGTKISGEKFSEGMIVRALEKKLTPLKQSKKSNGIKIGF
jgi:hypothetical protein